MTRSLWVESSDDAPFTFRWVCAQLRLNVEQAREALLAAGGATPVVPVDQASGHEAAVSDGAHSKQLRACGPDLKLLR